MGSIGTYQYPKVTIQLIFLPPLYQSIKNTEILEPHNQFCGHTTSQITTLMEQMTYQRKEGACHGDRLAVAGGKLGY